MRHSFVFDQNRCTGCDACRLACTIENGLPLTESWRRVHTFNPRRVPGIPLFHLSLACNHCAKAACMEACPALAYTRDSATGAVLVDEAKCIGCRYCSWACPYDAPLFDRRRGVMTKCTFCVERLRQGMAPACAAYCPTGALAVRQLSEDEITNGSEGFLSTDLGPAVMVVPKHGGSAVAAVTAEAGASVPSLPAASWAIPRPEPRVDVRDEWPLVMFTFLAIALVATLTASVAVGAGVSLPVFLGIAAIASLASTAHLGRRERAWRAVLNLRTSWLSREIGAFGLFVASGTLHLLLRDNRIVAWTAVALGFLTLASIDRVYAVIPRVQPRMPHSSSAVLTGLFLAGLLAGSALLAGVLALIKLTLYVQRKLTFVREGLPSRPLLSTVRVVVGYAVPLALWIRGHGVLGPVLILMVLIGEFIGRTEFYRELELVTPAGDLAVALERRLAAAQGAVEKAVA